MCLGSEGGPVAYNNVVFHEAMSKLISGLPIASSVVRHASHRALHVVRLSGVRPA